jgi:hypothetical protein
MDGQIDGYGLGYSAFALFHIYMDIHPFLPSLGPKVEKIVGIDRRWMSWIDGGMRWMDGSW